MSKKRRCKKCNKKLKTLFFTCKCKNDFCSKCRYPSDHNCTFDFVKENQEKLKIENPVIHFKKLEKINW